MDICDLNFCELTLSITALANSLAKDLNDEEVLLLSRIFTQLSHTMSTIASIRTHCSRKQNATDNKTSKAQSPPNNTDSSNKNADSSKNDTTSNKK